MLEIYTGDYCPYCHKVIDFLNENKISFINKDIKFEENRDVVLDMGGKMQIPFLVDREKNVSMYESSDIIDYIKGNYIK